MELKAYMELLYVFRDFFQKDILIVEFANGLSVKCLSDTGIFETSTGPEEDDYVGEYITVVKLIEILEPGSDHSVSIYNNYIEISLINIPEKISLEDGTLLWKRM